MSDLYFAYQLQLVENDEDFYGAVASASQAEAPLLRLPVEMLAWIAEDLAAPDLCNFRLCCRTTNEAGMDTFDCRYIRTRTVPFNGRRLRDLVRLTAQPRLARKIRKLEFTMIDRDMREVIDDDAEIWRATRGKEQNKLKEAFTAYMRRIWENFEAISKAPNVAIVADEHPAHPDVPLPEDVDRNVKLAPDQTILTKGAYVTSIVLRTMADVGIPLFDFELHADLGTVPMDVAKILECGLRLQQLRRVKIWLMPVSDVGGRTGVEIFQIAQKSKVLQSLDLWWEGWIPEPRGMVIGPILKELSTNKLRHLALREVDIYGHTLENVLDMYRGTLRELELERVTLWGQLTWKPPLIWMADHLELGEIVFDQLSMWRGKELWRWTTDPQTKGFSAAGNVHVKTALRNLAENGYFEGPTYAPLALRPA